MSASKHRGHKFASVDVAGARNPNWARLRILRRLWPPLRFRMARQIRETKHFGGRYVSLSRLTAIDAHLRGRSPSQRRRPARTANPWGGQTQSTAWPRPGTSQGEGSARTDKATPRPRPGPPSKRPGRSPARSTPAAHSARPSQGGAGGSGERPLRTRHSALRIPNSPHVRLHLFPPPHPRVILESK